MSAKTLAAVSGVFLLCSAASVTAFDLPQGLTFSGYTELENLFSDGETSMVLHGRGDVGIRLQGSGALSFGADIGFENIGVYVDDGSAERMALYAELVVEGGFGALSVGQTRSAAERIVELPDPGGARLLADRVGYATGPGLRLEHLYFGESLGLRYDGSFGAARVSASLNHIENYGNVAQIAAEFPIGAIVVEGALEVDLPSSEVSVLLGGQGSAGKVDAGLYVFNDAYYGNGTSLRGFASYHVTEQLAASAQIMVLEGGPLFGMDVKYSHSSGLYGQLGVANGSAIDAMVTDISIGYKF